MSKLIEDIEYRRNYILKELSYGFDPLYLYTYCFTPNEVSELAEPWGYIIGHTEVVPYPYMYLITFNKRPT